MPNPLVDLQRFGQSVWYDNMRRGLITSGDLQRLIADDGLRGMTSNPAIFEKAISGSADYAGVLGAHAGVGLSPLEIYERVAVEDIQWAADLLLPVYQDTQGRDGYVSLEVSPHLANDTDGTVEEALRLAAAVARPNLMVKVPGTPAGVPAVERLIGKGVNVNITLLFALDNYVEVAKAYMAGLDRLVENGGDPASVASVASFFISRIDAKIEKEIGERVDAGEDAAAFEGLAGKVAIANAKLTYARYKELCASETWQNLAAAGARPQRLLWASTGTKNPDYSDVLYVEELIGPDTVNTLPEATFVAFRDHGTPRASLEEGLEEAAATMERLADAGLSMERVTSELQEEAVRLFVEPFDQLLAAIETQTTA